MKESAEEKRELEVIEKLSDVWGQLTPSLLLIGIMTVFVSLMGKAPKVD